MLSLGHCHTTRASTLTHSIASSCWKAGTVAFSAQASPEILCLCFDAAVAAVVVVTFASSAGLSGFILRHVRWGEYSQATDFLADQTSATLSCAYGTLSITSLSVKSLLAPSQDQNGNRQQRRYAVSTATATVDGLAVEGTWTAATATFAFKSLVVLKLSSKLVVTIAPSGEEHLVDMEFSKAEKSSSSSTCAAIPTAMRLRPASSRSKASVSAGTSVQRGQAGVVVAVAQPKNAVPSPAVKVMRCVLLFVTVMVVFGLGVWCALANESALREYFPAAAAAAGRDTQHNADFSSSQQRSSPMRSKSLHNQQQNE